jgi:hypothetical protein
MGVPIEPVEETPGENRLAANALGVASGLEPIVALNAVRTSGAWRQSKRKPKHTASQSGWRNSDAAFGGAGEEPDELSAGKAERH